MARKCKCKICGKELTTDIAYKVIINNKNCYFCDEIEYENYIKERNYRDKLYENVCKILGYKSKNTIIFKEQNNLHELYTWEDINNCLEEKMDSISQLIKENNIEKEYNKIRYIFGAISRDIQDYSEEQKRLLQQRERELLNSNNIKIEDEEPNENILETDFTYQKTKQTDFSKLF